MVAPGQIFAGDFRIVQPLSVGGMGAVFVAEQLSTGKRRALKVMHAHIEAHPKLRERFAVEARVGSMVQSEHVVEVVGAGVDAESGSPWLAMELLDGSDLEEFLHERGPLSMDAGRNVLRQVGHALAAAHTAKIVHRDLKPANVFLARSQRADVPYTVKLLDFGIVKLLNELTQTGTEGIGTPLYMAPEQVTGKQIGPATDVWAYGLLAFAVWAGRAYWLADRDPIALFRELDRGAVELASARVLRFGLRAELPQGFDAWFARCLAVDPKARFVDVGAACGALDALNYASATPSAQQSPSASQAQSETLDGQRQGVPATLPGTEIATLPGYAATGAGPPAGAHGVAVPATPPPQRRKRRDSPRWTPVPSVRSMSPFAPQAPKPFGRGPPRVSRNTWIGLTSASACLLLFAVAYVVLDPFAAPETSSAPNRVPTTNASTTEPPAPSRHLVATTVPAREPGFLTLACVPECTRVQIAGRNLGPTPIVRHSLGPGSHQVIAISGALERRFTVEIRPRATTSRRIDMRSLPASPY